MITGGYGGVCGEAVLHGVLELRLYFNEALRAEYKVSVLKYGLIPAIYSLAKFFQILFLSITLMLFLNSCILLPMNVV
jgi:hypothetical protein